MSIIGHQKILSFFNTLIANDSLSQSYCFVGREMVGKRTVARYLSAQLLKIDETKLDTHPDFYYLSRQIDEKTEKLKKEISIAQARNIKERLGSRSWFGNYQAVIIDEAELLNEESGNALLKILEDPTVKRVFFLLTSDESKLLATIRSRCQVVYFGLVSDNEIAQGLMGMGYDKKIAKEVSGMAWGRPGRAVELSAQEELRSDYYNELTRWENIVNEPFYKKLIAVEDLLKDSGAADTGKVDSIRTGEKLQNILETWQVVWRSVILDKLQNKENKILAKHDLPMPAMVSLMGVFKKSQALLAQNINPKLVVEQILLSLP